MPSVQFRNSEDTVTAFENLNCGAWSLWDGKRFMFKGTGKDELEKFLDLMTENGASNAVYTLAYYEGVDSGKKINNKTPFDGSFNFRLNAEEMEVNTGEYKHFIKQQSLLSKVNGLESKFDLLIEKLSGEVEPEKNNLGIVGQLLEHPAIAPLLPGLVQAVAGNLFGTVNANRPATEPRQLYPVAAKVSGIGNVMEQDTELETAVAALLQYDTRLTEHLKKLALLAQRDPTTFNYIMAQLDQMRTE